MLQPYIQHREEISRIFCFCRSAKMDFQRLAGPRNVSVDFSPEMVPGNGQHYLKNRVTNS